MHRRSRRRAVLLSSLAVFLLSALAPAAGAPPVSAGETAVAPRIVGGFEVDPPGKYPFVVALIHASAEDEYQGQFCGGSLIAPEWVLTAGHCLGLGTGGIDVLVGRIDLTDDTQGERIATIASYRHPDFDRDTLANDVALLRLERAATMGSTITLAQPADAPLFAPGVWATVVGWGATLGLPPGAPEDPQKLREVNVPILSDEACTTAWGDSYLLPDMLCAGDLVVGGIDACFGDSGGPMFVGSLQVGVVSGGQDCGNPEWPGLYSRVATYQAWIASTLESPPPPPPPVPTCDGRPATIVGTAGADVLLGSAGRDVIVALGGDDIVRGYGGNDIICLGEGDDRAYGGPGNDIILGQGGADYVEGGGGADQIIGGDGPDILLGGDGPDSLWGNRGNDSLRGLGGDDLLWGGAGDDSLLGGAGNDQLRGGPGTDTLVGGAGTDSCSAGEAVVC